MSEHVQTHLNLLRFNMIQIVTISAIFKHVWTCWYMSKLVQIQYDMNWIHRILKHVWTRSNKQFRFNIIQIVTIHMILKHVWHVQTYLNLSRFRMSIWANGTWNVLHWQSVWIASSKSSDQKWKPLQSFSEILSIKWLEMLLPKRFHSTLLQRAWNTQEKRGKTELRPFERCTYFCYTFMAFLIRVWRNLRMRTHAITGVWKFCPKIMMPFFNND